MRWLAGNTHLMHGSGYDWSIRSMGKAIDALHDAMVVIAGDGKKLLDETFMNNIFFEDTRGQGRTSMPSAATRGRDAFLHG